MNRLALVLVALLFATGSVAAQPVAGKSIEATGGPARRISFPLRHRRDTRTDSGPALDRTDLSFGKYIRRRPRASISRPDSTTTRRWSRSLTHRRALSSSRDDALVWLLRAPPMRPRERAAPMLAADFMCRPAGVAGEERYDRRASCERRQQRPEAQGIPVVCR